MSAPQLNRIEFRKCTGHVDSDVQGPLVDCPRQATLVCTGDSRMQWFACDDPAHSSGCATTPIQEFLGHVEMMIAADEAEHVLRGMNASKDFLSFNPRETVRTSCSFLFSNWKSSTTLAR